ncbi:MAG: DUF898 family protein [Nitrospirae bacterium]|nr:DUF898 family protein [Nitrospirota bacterium]
MGTPQGSYKIIFEGEFRQDIPREEIRQRLLRVFRGSHEVVDRFFSSRRLVIKKALDHQTALKITASLERAGVRCRIVEDQGPLPAGVKVSDKPVPQTGEGPAAGDRAAVPAKPCSIPQAGVNQPQAGETAERPALRDNTPHRTSGTSSLKGSRPQQAIAGAMILLLLGCIGLRFWALSEVRTILPPDNVDSNGSVVCLHMNKSLYLLSPAGKLIQRLELPKSGVNREPADIQLLRNNDILIGDLDKGEILRCTGAAPSCRKIGPADNYRIAENFRFLADEERNMLFIADTNNHKLLVQDMEGTYLSVVETGSNISYPNDMTFDAEGRLWLSDTRNSRVLAFDAGERSASYAGKVIETASLTVPPPASGLGAKDLGKVLEELGAKKQQMQDDLIRTRPLALSWDSAGNLWVVASDGIISTAAVKVFSPDGKQVGRVPLGDGSIPVGIVRQGDTLLLADSGLFEIFRLGPAADQVAVFGDDGFRQELSALRDRLRQYEAIKKWSGIGIWLLAAGTLILVIVIAVGNAGKKAGAVRSVRPMVPAQALARADGPAGDARDDMPLKKYRLEFTGAAEEYFRIWIVNVFLTIATLGLYAAWAKVRTRRYFYRNTLLDGHPFDYTADPKAILKGYLIVGAGVGIYSLTRTLNPFYGLAVAALIGLVMPLLIYKSLRFFTHHSVYRNIRHRFLGTLGESYRTYLLVPLLIPLTLGLIVPYWEFLKKRYFFRNVAFGAETAAFEGTHGPFYPAYIRIGLATAGIMLAGTVTAGIFFAGAKSLNIADKAQLSGAAMWMAAWVYGLMVLAVTFSQQYLYAWTTNYCLGRTGIGKIRFESTLSGGRLFWIRLSNIIAIIFSLGLLTPWAKVRRMRYLVDNIAVVGADLNGFAAAAEPGESAYGDTAADFFDLEIGL